MTKTQPKENKSEMMMKIAIIGSRNYTNKTQIKNFMFRLKMEYKQAITTSRAHPIWDVGIPKCARGTRPTRAQSFLFSDNFH